MTLANGTNSATLIAVESVVGGTGSDAITLGATISAIDFNGSTGNDSLTLATGNNTATLTLVDVESIIGGSGTDTITLGTNATNTHTISAIEGLVGNAGF